MNNAVVSTHADIITLGWLTLLWAILLAQQLLIVISKLLAFKFYHNFAL